MNYDFETVVRRYGTGSGKWDEMRSVKPEVKDDVIPFSVADMELKTPPEIVEGLKRFLDQSILGYAQPTDRFKEAVCGWMKQRHHWTIEKDWIVSTHGVVDAFFLAIKAFTKEKDGVMLMTPVYYPMNRGIEVNKRTLVETKLINTGTRYEIDFEDFERKASDPGTKMLILCSPHNPTGRVWTQEELKRIGNICIENHVLIVSDEIHFDLVMPGYHHTVFASLSQEFADNTITCTAPSKTFNLAGLQTSNIIISNPRLRERYLEEIQTAAGSVRCNILGYEACRIAYEECEDWLEQVIALVDLNRQIVRDYLKEYLPCVKMMDMEGTYLAWIDFNPLGLSYQELERIMRQDAELFFDEGYIFGEAGKGFERWNLACPTDYVRAGLERMRKALEPMI